MYSPSKLRESGARLPRLRMRGARALLEALMGYPGESWEQRWLASGFDAAARSWMNYLDLPIFAEGSPSQLGMNALLPARVLRPSYSFLLDSRGKVNTRDFLDAVGGSTIDELRQLPSYRAVLPRQKKDAEAGLARLMIRTGKADQ